MANRLDGRKIAILATDGFEQVELTEPMKALKEAGATVTVVSPSSGSIKGFKHDKPGDEVNVDQELSSADASAFDGLMIPGGLFNPDALRRDQTALAFAKAFFDAGKPVAAICHGPQVLISAGLVKGRKMTGFEAIQIDLKNAGAIVSDEAVVVDRGLVTSRKPDDIPAFNAKMVEQFAEGRHAGQRSAA
ncbi:type 1 glutamine amidotransferase domain-containing protein [Hansschlegelia sp.]|uniref:type 1 glutamine amidotransferase domain-containing protein n=1 Tax=Hansschlegelia sp. TaxID=2041892 RepID=UPI002CBDCCE3|nr:type 1 glutamine amidotransferase domain-containing protein [Hansschlegelia sp.]HVI28767.1 type 1 glutamine amidotransferase domain-containing protein [Hansschlegelia sp.]